MLHMEINLEKLKDFLEIVYFLSGPVIAFLAYKALGQIKIGKEQLEANQQALVINSRRDALKLTAQQIEVFNSVILNFHNILNNTIREHKLQLLKQYKVECKDGSIKVVPPKNLVPKEDLIKIVPEVANLANALESFSVAFTSQVANEKVAFNSIGAAYCSAIESVAPVILLAATDGKAYSSCLKLYFIWRQRIERDDLEKAKQELDKKLSSTEDITIKVFGDDSKNF